MELNGFYRCEQFLKMPEGIPVTGLWGEGEVTDSLMLAPRYLANIPIADEHGRPVGAMPMLVESKGLASLQDVWDRLLEQIKRAQDKANSAIWTPQACGGVDLDKILGKR